LKEEDRRELKAIAAMFGYVLWDNDFVPMDNHEGINLGTANMPVQQSSYRNMYALLLAEHPSFQERAPTVREQALSSVRATINEAGSHMGCPGYISTSLAPTLNSLMQIQQLGLANPIKEEPRLSALGEFYLNLITPPEPRAKDKRTIIVLGDGTYGQPGTLALFGQLGTFLSKDNPETSAKLMQAWDETGKAHSGFFGTTTLMIDDRLPRADLKLGDGHFDGYFTVLRAASGTPAESAVWLVDGEFYKDHRHPGDRGSIVAYLLGTPIVSQWGSFYTPYVPGSYFKPVVLTEALIGRPWDADSPGTGTGGDWDRSQHKRMVTHPEGALAEVICRGREGFWNREVALIRADENAPILFLNDTFGGRAAKSNNVLTLPLEAHGPVQTPAGPIDPPVRKHERKAFPNSISPPEMLPSATPPIDLAAGVNRFGFTGNFGIDFDVFVITENPAQALLGNWEILMNNDRPQNQHFLRVRTQGPFRTVIVPYPKGKRPANLEVTLQGDAIQVIADDRTTRLSPEGFSFSGAGGKGERKW